MKNLTALVALATFTFSNVTFAHVDMTQCRSETLKVADLDVSTVDGAAALFQRLNHAADRVCRDTQLDRALDWSQGYAHCVSKALSDAVAQVNAPAVIAFAKKHGVYPLKDARCT